MVKSFDEFNKMYTQKEFDAIKSILSEYYTDEDIEDFINSKDIELKEDFLLDSEIENIRVCQCCGKFILEGYLYQDYETYCSDKCFISTHSKSEFQNADEDILYWTAFEN